MKRDIFPKYVQGTTTNRIKDRRKSVSSTKYVDSNSDNESDMERDDKGFGLYQNGDDSHNRVKPIKVKVAVTKSHSTLSTRV